MLHSDTGSRTEDLLEELGLSSHILYDIEDFNSFDIFKFENTEEVKERIMSLREKSMSFLKSSLG